MFLRVFTYVMLAITLLPLGLIFVTSFTADAYVSFPPTSFSIHGYVEALGKDAYFKAFALSLWIALFAAAVATGLGTLVAVGLVRYRFRGRDFVQALFMSPVILPSLVIGIALLQFFNRLGLVSIAGLILGHIIITIPFAIRLVGVSLAGFDGTLELAARNLGASPIAAFRKVTLPLIRPGILAGGIFAFITSFDNVTISVFLASPTVVPFPVMVFTKLDQPVIEPWLVALCSLVMAWTAILTLIIQRAVGLQGLFAR